MPEEPREHIQLPANEDWQYIQEERIQQTKSEWADHMAAKGEDDTPQSIYEPPIDGPRPPPVALGSKELYSQWRQRVSPKNTQALGHRPSRHLTMIKGRPVCVWILSHLHAPIVEWDSYFSTIFMPVTPRVVYGVTSRKAEAGTENMVSHHCVMEAWRVSEFRFPPA